MTTDLRRKLKELLIERLKFEDMTPDDIPDEEPLFAGGLGCRKTSRNSRR